jgi:basic amino acid/polyamine antiporter, APA family
MCISRGPSAVGWGFCSPGANFGSSGRARLVVGIGPTGNAFESMVIFITPGFWFFLMLVGVSLFVLRYREPDTERPFRVPGYPVTPILFCLSCAPMVYSSVDYAVTHRSWEALWSIAWLLAGVPLSFYKQR